MAEKWLDSGYEKRPGVAVIYLAGGCFWGIQKMMQAVPGVISVISGYANGNGGEAPTYSSVCTGATGFRETVRVEYDPQKVSLDALLFAFFSIIDPGQKNAQGADSGTQYQTGVYYPDEQSGETARRIAQVERERHQRFFTEIEPIRCFYEAEAYHQNYLDKTPYRCDRVLEDRIRSFSRMVTDPAHYRRPEKTTLAALLSDEQIRVTREAATEPPFENALWNQFQRGIYVDVVTGEPLFTSKDKYAGSCGWPSFSAGLDDNALRYLEDRSHGMVRTEVRSRAGNSHLGHVFFGDHESPNGVRYCINSAALRFIPYADMDAAGYGELKRLLDVESPA